MHAVGMHRFPVEVGIDCLGAAGSGIEDPVARAAMGESTITRFADALTGPIDLRVPRSMEVDA